MINWEEYRKYKDDERFSGHFGTLIDGVDYYGLLPDHSLFIEDAELSDDVERVNEGVLIKGNGVHYLLMKFDYDAMPNREDSAIQHTYSDLYAPAEVILDNEGISVNNVAGNYFGKLPAIEFFKRGDIRSIGIKRAGVIRMGELKPDFQVFIRLSENRLIVISFRDNEINATEIFKVIKGWFSKN